MTWLPEGKTAAICLSVDDVHPSTSADLYEAGGDLAAGALGQIESLLDRHNQLKVTLFVTPDWRPMQLVRSRCLTRIPVLSELLYHVDLHPKGRFAVNRHPNFVRYINSMERVDVGVHGLHHVHRGAKLAVEFQEQSHAKCMRIVLRSLEVFRLANLNYKMGFAPPGWNLPEPLADVLDELNFSFVCSARDIRTPISRGSRSSMSGLQNMSLIRPQRVGNRRLVHIPINFQATSTLDRADSIVNCGGLLSIKAHAFKHGGGFTLLDGLDPDYCSYLDRLFSHLESRYGDSLWWTSIAEVARHWNEQELKDGSLPQSTCDLGSDL